MSQTPFTIGALQMRYEGNPKAQLDKACAMLEQAAAKGVQVACLPELFLTDYFCQTHNPDLFNLAEPIDGPTTQALAKVAKKTGMVIINSIFEKRAAGVYHNTAVIIEKDGSTAGIYRKMHIPHDPLFFEKYYFTPGDTGFKAFDTTAGKFGTLICWDQWYPEGARLTALQGANALFYPTAIGWQPYEKAEFGEAQLSAWITIQRSHAIANGVYVCAVNRIGHEGPKDAGIEFWGNSFIADPFGRILAQASSDKEEILTAQVDPKWGEQTRRWWPFMRDRRIDAYGDITKRFGN
ncbi:MAG: carbon-nitrogen hydrolase [Rickettsiales bacterium]|nr:carbon-nitrogen hydrolase [Rickettsiales bacterium]